MSDDKANRGAADRSRISIDAVHLRAARAACYPCYCAFAIFCQLEYPDCALAWPAADALDG